MSDESQDFIKRVDRRDRLVRNIEVGLLLLVTIFNIVMVIQTRQVINQNQQSAVEARQANIDRQSQMTAYIKCVLLIRYDTPADQLQTRTGVETALDKCASSTAKR